MRRKREKEISSLRSFVDGAFFATIIFLLLFMVIDFKIKDETWISVFGSFVVAAFTIAAAWVALRGNRVQITQNNDLEDERRENSLIAARAVLPSLLSEMATVARNNLMFRFAPGHEPAGFRIPRPTAFHRMPESIIPELKQCIQYADSISQDRLANILRHFQVQQVRETEVGAHLIAPSEHQLTFDNHRVISDAIGWAVVYGLIVDAFAYARGTTSAIPASLNPEFVRHAFDVGGVYLPQYPLVDNILKDRIKNNLLERQWDI